MSAAERRRVVRQPIKAEALREIEMFILAPVPAYRHPRPEQPYKTKSELAKRKPLCAPKEGR